MSDYIFTIGNTEHTVDVRCLWCSERRDWRHNDRPDKPRNAKSYRVTVDNFLRPGTTTVTVTASNEREAADLARLATDNRPQSGTRVVEI